VIRRLRAQVQALDKFDGAGFIRFGNFAEITGHPGRLGAGGEGVDFDWGFNEGHC